MYRLRSRWLSLALPCALSLAACSSDPDPFTPQDSGADVATDLAGDTGGADVQGDVVRDTSSTDAPQDSRTDAPSDGGADVPQDTARDAPGDGGADVPQDTARDVPGDDGGASGGTCGGFAGLRCASSEYCDYAPGALCGAADATGVCAPRPETCTGEVSPVCGCDTRTYNNACEAHRAGVSVARTGRCVGGACDAQDAVGSGVCGRFFGYYWNGTACVGVSGCSCSGVDCERPFSSVEACRAVYGACEASDCRSAGCSSGQTCQACRGAGGIVYVCIPEGAAC